MDLNQLRKEIIKAPQDKEILIGLYLKDPENEERYSLVKSIQRISWTSISIILGLYLEHRDIITARDLVKNNDKSMFEVNDETYQFAGFKNDRPQFIRLGSIEIIDAPFSLDDKVTRIF